MSIEEVRRRAAMAREVMRAALSAVIGAGYTVTVSYGDDDCPVRRSRDIETILEATQACDEEWLYIYDGAGEDCGFIALVHGNDGWDVIADHSVSLDPLLADATELAERLSEEDEDT